MSASDPLRELLSSPLEDAPKRSQQRIRRRDRLTTPGVPWLVGGVVAGAIAVLLGYLVARPSEATPLQTTTTAATTTTLATQSEAVLPTGYTEIADGRLGVRVERVLIRPDALFVTISTVVPSGLDGEETAGFPGGRWELRLDDGTVLMSTMESRTPTSPGFATIRFDTEQPTAGDPESLHLNGLGVRLTDEVSSGSSVAFSIPDDGEGPVSVALQQDRFEIDDGVELVLGDIVFEDGFGRLGWRLEGVDPEARAATSPILQLFDESTGNEIPVVSPGGFGGFVFAGGGNFFFEDFTLSREGETAFTPIDPSVPFPTETPMTATLTVPVIWQVYTPTSTEIPIDDALIVEL